MMRLYLTPVDDYLVLSDIQHFNSHLISGLLQVHHTKGWILVCIWDSHSVGLGHTDSWEQRQHRSHISPFFVTEVQFRSVCKLGRGQQAEDMVTQTSVTRYWHLICA